jgi:hypothetical protein
MSLPQPNPVSFISQAHQPISQQNNTQYYHQNHNIGLAPPTFLSKPQSVITQPLHHQNFETNAALHLSNAGNMNINMIKNPTNTLNTDANSHSFNLNKNDIRTTNTTVTMNSINVDNMINKANTPANVKVSLNPSTIHKKNTSNTQATDINKYKEIHSIEQMKTHEK